MGARKEDYVVATASRAVSLVIRNLLVLMLCAGLPASAALGSETALELLGAGRAQTRDLTLEDLAALPQVTVHTENEFSDGVVAYRGPLVRDVLAELGLDRLEQPCASSPPTTITSTFRPSDFADYDVILAMEADGEPLSRRDKGPLWLMYPISDHAGAARSDLPAPADLAGRPDRGAVSGTWPE